MSRSEVDLQNAVKKACNADEVPPKRKHVRACIVDSWDQKNSRAFWNAIKIQPLQSNEVQLFKALIMMHKVLQEGHPNCLKDGYRNRDFIQSLGRVFPSQGLGYGRLIAQYDRYILQKLDFHRNNPNFTGMFEYDEYISLRAVNDPNEGYELLLQLMDLQDLIDSLQKLIFATIAQTPNNLCRISALVPLISESYGIYKFCTSMLRAMHQQLGDDEALMGLFDRFNSQHFMLRDFYTDCHSLKFLTSLVTVPRLPNNPPDLKVADDDSEVPSRPAELSSQPTGYSNAQSSENGIENREPPQPQLSYQPTGVVFLQQQQQEQERIQRELELRRQQQVQEQVQQQRLFEEQQRQQAQSFMQQQQMLQQQQTQQQSRVAELEHDLLMFKNQYDNDQQLLQQYDGRVKGLETELMTINSTASEQVAAKDEQIRNLEEQISNWSKKYESLAKLYSQLRQEHLNLLAKFKKIQQKINSAQESILKKEKFEKDLKAKNIELADLIRERDRARLELDRLRGTKDQEIEKLEAQLRDSNLQLNESGKMQSLNMSTIISRHQNEVEDLKRQLEQQNGKSSSQLEKKLKDKEVDLEIAQESLESALKELELSKSDQDDVINAQIDHILLQNIEKQKNLVDIFLASSAKRIANSKHELFNPMQAGNLNASPEYFLSIIELCSDLATEFARTFNDYLVEGKQTYGDDENLSISEIILTSSELVNNMNELMLNGKGICNAASKDNENGVYDRIAAALNSTELFFLDLQSLRLSKIKDDEDKIDKVIDCNVQLQNDLQELGRYVDDNLRSSSGIDFQGNLENLVDNEMNLAVKIVDKATNFLTQLMVKGGHLEVHDAILNAAKAITEAIKLLIIAATNSQKEIVEKEKGSSSPTEFYRKNSRWTEGLISASKAVAGATNILIQTADGVLLGSNSNEQLIVASNEVAASTAQLVAASRVKAKFKSREQDKLEDASVHVSSACKSLVAKVQSLISKEEDTKYNVDLNKLTTYEGKTLEMEQQVEILKLENMLSSARKRLGEIRKRGYKDDNSDDEP